MSSKLEDDPLHEMTEIAKNHVSMVLVENPYHKQYRFSDPSREEILNRLEKLRRINNE